MAKPDQVRVVFFRSGRTDWDVEGRIAGSTDLPLAAVGLSEVDADAKALGPATLSAVLCGPDEASRVTATVVARAAGGSPKIKPIVELSEICLGLWEGQLRTELSRKCPSVCRQWKEDPGAVIVPEGETFLEAQDRVATALRKALSRSAGDGAVAVVLRPIALGLALCWIDGAGIRTVWPMVDGARGPIWRTLRRELLRSSARRPRAEV